MIEKITPRVDIAFKKIFGVEENKDLLISLINAVVSSEDQVADVTLLNPYNPQNFQRDKLSILDIKARGLDGKRFNIEIQITDEADYDKRALYYWAKLYAEQLSQSEKYSNLSKAVGIHILNFTSIVGEKKYHNVFRIQEKESGIHYFKDLELHTIELQKFCDNVHADLAEIAAKVKNSLDMWTTFLTRHDLLNKEQLEAPFNSPELKKALDVLEVMNLQPQEREIYEDHLKWLRFEDSALRKSENKGETQGFTRGLEQGFEQGLHHSARQMLKDGVSPQDISKWTGLPLSEIHSLKDAE